MIIVRKHPRKTLTESIYDLGQRISFLLMNCIEQGKEESIRVRYIGSEIFDIEIKATKVEEIPKVSTDYVFFDEEAPKKEKK